MTYKTVLVHCNDKRRVARVTEAAAAVAHRFQAHLIGLHHAAGAIIPSGMPALRRHRHRRSLWLPQDKRRHARLSGSCRRANSTVEWQEARRQRRRRRLVLPRARGRSVGCGAGGAIGRGRTSASPTAWRSRRASN
jgi:hypothetical protein